MDSTNTLRVKLKSAPEIEGSLSMPDVKQALKSAFIGLADGSSVQPPQTLTLFPENKGDFITYLGVLQEKGIFGSKLSPFLVARAERGDYPVTAYTLVLSMDTGEPLLLCDSLALTTERTAATTALALDYLVPENAKKLAVIGSGKIAMAHLRYASRQHPWQEISVYSPALSDENSTVYAEKRKQLEEISRLAAPVESAKTAVTGADVVLLCTSSGTPVIENDWLNETVTVTSIATNVARAHEIDPATLNDYHVFCDYRKTAPLSAGEMVIAGENTAGRKVQLLQICLSWFQSSIPGVNRRQGRYFSDLSVWELKILQLRRYSYPMMLNSVAVLY